MNPKPLTDSDKTYLKEKHKTTPVTVMAKDLKRSYKTLYDYLEANGLEIFRLQSARRGNRDGNYDPLANCCPITGFPLSSYYK